MTRLFPRLSKQDARAIQDFMRTLEANRHLDIPEFKDLVRGETRKLSPVAKRFVLDVFKGMEKNQG